MFKHDRAQLEHRSNRRLLLSLRDGRECGLGDLLRLVCLRGLLGRRLRLLHIVYGFDVR